MRISDWSSDVCSSDLELAVHRYLVINTLSTPSVDNSKAADAPAGPEPITNTSVSTLSVDSDPDGAVVETSPSTGMPHPPFCAEPLSAHEGSVGAARG